MPSNSSGHLPLTHYERTKKFKSSSYGTTTTRLSGDTQVAFGHCSLSLTPVIDEDAKAAGKGEDATLSTLAMVTPSGHLYAKEAIINCLLKKTAEYKEKLALYERQKLEDAEKADTTETVKRQREEAFDKSNRLPQHDKKRIKPGTGKNSDLVRTSYWLADMQPDEVAVRHKEPDRPSSPYSGDPLRRKDLREVELQRKENSEDVLCAVSGKVVRVQPAVAYWVKDKSRPGVVVLKDVYEMTIDTSKKKKPEEKADKLICPLSGQKIKHTIELKTGGSGFASHNAVEVKTYRPTIT